ncbi:MAG: PAS domain S-box protein [Desulfatiglans sp.]|jgi:PAS domain S-box-containing protein|nr:PAS domain S-box protein [Thermodesulfobacteriota bacterium]MEE4351842.1 PAS domain S-box protein [Desulfatiglans sp.]
MEDDRKSKEQLVEEIGELRRRVAELEGADKERTKEEKALWETREIDLQKLTMGKTSFEERFLALFEDNLIETIIVDHKGKVIGSNLEKKRRDGIGPKTGDIMYKDYAGGHEIDMLSRLKKCLKSGMAEDFPKLKYNDRFLHIRIAPYSDGAIITSIDITDRVNLEDLVQKNQKQARFLANALESSPQPFAVAYSDGRIMTYNNAYCDLTGYTKEELRKVKWFEDLTPPEFHEVMAKATEKMIRTGKPQRYEKEYIRKDGSRVPVEVLQYPAYDGNGNLHHYYSFITNTDERRRMEDTLKEKGGLLQKNENKLNTIYEHAPLMILGVGSEGRLALWNKECEKALGWKKEDLSTIDQLMSLTFPDPAESKEIKRIFTKTDGVFRRCPARTKDGTLRTQEWGAFSFPDDIILCFGRDVTEEWTAKQTGRQLEARLKEADSELVQVRRALSTSIETPLRAIRNYSAFLMEDIGEALGDKSKKFLDGLGVAVEEARELIQDILDLSDIGNKNGPPETIDMGNFLHRLVASLELPPGTDVVIDNDWPSIETEPLLLGQVFFHLIDNAVKFNTSPSKLVQMGWKKAEEHRYDFFVRDNGIGIKARYLEQIFGVFQRLHTAQEYSGSGIGLAITKKAVSKLGGSVRVESEPGEGSTFYINLSAKQSPSDML